MIIYIVRHAEAVERQEGLADEWRFLTEKGRRDAAKTAKGIPALGPKPRRIITSPLTRAVQTAEIMAGFACRKRSVQASTLLLPEEDVSPLVHFLAQASQGRIMLVGHEPQLGELLAALLGSDSPLVIKKGGCVALKATKGGRWEFLWYLVPGRRPVESLKKAFSRQHAAKTDFAT